MKAVTRLSVALAMIFVMCFVSAETADAHGAPIAPMSRTAECGPEGGALNKSSACVAAIATGGRKASAEWDNLRVAGVDGRDREEIPDPKLCSGGVGTYKGLDLARADWPTTSIESGSSFTFKYRTTIPHAGTFRMYLTNDSWNPSLPLAWEHVEQKPFLTVEDPPIRDESYVMTGKLPDQPGRRIIYTIWQNSESEDTYYSCSDVVLTSDEDAATTATTATEAPADTQRVPAVNQADVTAAPENAASSGTPAWIYGVVLVVGVASIAGVSTVAQRRRR